MARPLMQHGIAQLEAMFASSGTDPKVLKQLEGELKHRQVPRAVNLLSEVQASLRDSTRTDTAKGGAQPPHVLPPPVVSPQLVAQPRQPELWPLPGSAKAAAGPSVHTMVPASAGNVHPPTRTATEARPAPAISPDAAYLLLKATTTTPWELVEEARRQLVDAAHPSRLAALTPEKRAQVQDIARRANAAYAVLHALRTTTD